MPVYIDSSDSELYHHGIKGQKWGVRRYQNSDGSLTDAGRRRQARSYQKELNKLNKRLEYDTVTASNSARSMESQANLYTKNMYKSSKMKKADNRFAKRANKNLERLELAAKTNKLVKDDYNKAQLRGNEILDKIEKEGYAFKVSQVNFDKPHILRQSRQLIKENSAVTTKDVNRMLRRGGWGFGNRYKDQERMSNVSSGNRFTVRDASQISENRRERYKRNNTLQNYRPQRYIVRYS